MLVTAHHGTTVETAALVMAGEPLQVSNNKGDWLGTGVYFWQDAPKRAAVWAGRAATKHRTRPAVLEATIDLSECFDLLDLFNFETLQLEYEEFAALAFSQEQGPLEIVDGATVYPTDGTKLVDRNKRDKAVIDFAAASIEAKTGKAVRVVRSPFLWGTALYPSSFIFNWSNVHICVRDHSVIQNLKVIA